MTQKFDFAHWYGIPYKYLKEQVDTTVFSIQDYPEQKFLGCFVLGVFLTHPKIPKLPFDTKLFLFTSRNILARSKLNFRLFI